MKILFLGILRASAVILITVVTFSCAVVANSENIEAPTTTTTLPPHNDNPQDYYVSVATGSDTANNGKSAGAPFKTLKKAADNTKPGDTVYVMNGTYSSSNGTVLNITRSGNATQLITYRPYNNDTPKIMATENVWNAVSINASYILFEGFELAGDNQNISLAQAQASYNDALAGTNNVTPRGKYNTNGISIGGPNKDSKLPHHVTIRNCVVHDWPGAGISSIQADYTTIEKNIVYNNAWWTMYGASGISILNPFNSDYSSGYRNKVSQNKVYNNKTLIFWIGANPPRRSDGNGIILDVNVTPYKNGVAPDNLPYGGRTLVQNNVSFNNGGSGIHAYLADHVDIINNTAYHNGTEVGYHDIFLNSSKDSKVINNIIYARTFDSGHDTFSNPSPWYISTSSTSTNAGSLYDYNVYYNVTITGTGKGVHSIEADPQFVSLSTDPGVADFTLQSNSPAINTGRDDASPSIDITDYNRPSGAHVDIGAYEYH